MITPATPRPPRDADANYYLPEGGGHPSWNAAERDEVPGLFWIHGDYGLDHDFDVLFRPAGTALLGQDYTLEGATLLADGGTPHPLYSVTVRAKPDGEGYWAEPDPVPVIVRPTDDADLEPGETVWLMLEATDEYTVMGAQAGFVSIADDDRPDLTAFRTGLKFGKQVDEDATGDDQEAVENAGDPADYLLLVNNDYEQDSPLGNDLTARNVTLPDSEAPNADGEDDDLAKVVLHQVPPALYRSTARLTASDGNAGDGVAFDPASVRFFTEDGSPLTGNDLTASFATNLGYLAALKYGDVTVWVEGASKAPDVKLQLLYADPSASLRPEGESAADDVHLRIANMEFVDRNNDTVAVVDTVPMQRLLDLANGVSDTPPIPETAHFWTLIDGLPGDDTEEVKTTSATVPADSFIDSADPQSPSSFRSQLPTIIYSGDPDEVLTDDERQLIRDNLGVNAVHNQEAPSTQATTRPATAPAGDVERRPAAAPAWTYVPDQQQAFDLIVLLTDDLNRWEREATAYANARGSLVVKPRARDALKAAIIDRYNQINAGQTNPRRLKVLFAGHGGVVNVGPLIGGGANEQSDPIFEPNEVSLDAYSDAQAIQGYRDDVLPGITIFDALTKIDELDFSNCKVADSAGSQRFWDAVRQKAGITKITAGKKVLGTAWRRLGGTWVTEISAYRDDNTPLPKDTPNTDVLYFSGGQ